MWQVGSQNRACIICSLDRFSDMPAPKEETLLQSISMFISIDIISQVPGTLSLPDWSIHLFVTTDM